jgi:putative tryptophan/tyrosine transport system substrate-binding protein
MPGMSADDQYDRLPALAAELVRRRVAVIVISGSPTAYAVKAATATIPIVFQTGVDPVATGLVASLNHPGGNVTGVTNVAVSLGTKRLQLVRQLLPAVTVVDVLVNPTNRLATEPQSKELQAAAQILGLQLRFLDARTADEFDTVFATVARDPAGALLLTDEVLFNNRADQLVALAARYAVPVIYTFREFTAAGGLISYASNLAEMNRQAGTYTARILSRREAGRSARVAADQVRVGDQPQDRDGPRPGRTAVAARHCRRGDRMMRVKRAGKEMVSAE